jgi:hypothetical protein
LNIINIVLILLLFTFAFSALANINNSTADGDFKHLHAVVVDSNNYVYTTDEDKGNVQKFTSDGQFVTKWGKWGKCEGEMREVHGIVTDSEDSVYIVDTRTPEYKNLHQMVNL